MITCPSCGNEQDVPDIDKGYRNAENYGSNVFTFQCPECKGKMKIGFKRTVVIDSVMSAHPKADLSF